MAMRSLPANFLPGMTKPQKEEFTNIYSRLLVQSYSLALDRYTRSKIFRLIFEEERIEGSDARVRSRLLTPKKKYFIAYRLHQQRNKWLIYDVSYDGLSQVENYRVQLDRVGKKFGYNYQEIRYRIRKRLRPSLRHLPSPQIKMRFWGVCHRP
jgi:ABC-type transporter MlaC component